MLFLRIALDGVGFKSTKLVLYARISGNMQRTLRHYMYIHIYLYINNNLNTQEKLVRSILL